MERLSWKELARRRDEVKTELNTSHEDVRIDENLWAPFWGVGSEKEPYTRCDSVKTKPADKHVWTTTEDQKENSRSVSALSHYDLLLLFA